jgi:hypothetical protein
MILDYGGLMMKKVGSLSILLLLLAVLSVGALAQPQNLSTGRGLGIGLQLPCAMSARYWRTDKLGLEGNILLFNEQLCLAGKLLLRLGDTTNLDLYTVLGGWYQSSPHESAIRLFALAGMELSISPNLALNLEFGEWLSLEGQYDLMIGTGIHFYFPREED